MVAAATIAAIDIVGGGSTAQAAGPPAATIVDATYGRCLDSNYDGAVYLHQCINMDHFQQWEGVNATLVNMQTGLCLDSNTHGDVYTGPCNGGSFQNWGGGGEQLVGDRGTGMTLTTDGPDRVYTAGPLGFQSQHWSTHDVGGVCASTPLKMVIDQQLPDKFQTVVGQMQSPQPPVGSWTVSVAQSTGRSVTGTTTLHLGVDFGVGMLKASVGGDISAGVTASEDLSQSQSVQVTVPKGVTLYANFGAHEHDFIFHWHRDAKDCMSLDSGRYELIVPYSHGFKFDCVGANCVQLVSDVNPLIGPVGFGPPVNPPPPGPAPTSVTYTGPGSADYHDPFTATAKVDSGGSPVTSGQVTFRLGGVSCTSPVDTGGVASCPITPQDAAGGKTLYADYGGASGLESSSTTAEFSITREETTLAYTGPGRMANGVPVNLSAVLKEDGSAPIAGRAVDLALGAGASRQSCTGSTDASGTARCTIAKADQPLNDTATVPVTAAFAGDGFYQPSNTAATVRLEYYTGRGYGLSASVNLLLTSLSIDPTPDTGPIRTASVFTTDTACTASAGTVLVNADALCPKVSTSLAPGTATTVTRVADASLGLPGLPVIGISGLTVTSTSTCESTSGSVSLALTIAGSPVTVPTAPNSVIPLAGGGRLIINEQTPATDADSGLTVHGVHLVLPGAVDVVLGSAASGAHNCR